MKLGEKGRDKEKTCQENSTNFGTVKPRMGVYSRQHFSSGQQSSCLVKAGS